MTPKTRPPKTAQEQAALVSACAEEVRNKKPRNETVTVANYPFHIAYFKEPADLDYRHDRKHNPYVWFAYCYELDITTDNQGEYSHEQLRTNIKQQIWENIEMSHHDGDLEKALYYTHADKSLAGKITRTVTEYMKSQR